MNAATKGTTMYEQMPVISELNRVKNFDPLHFLRKVMVQGKEVFHLDLKYKKLWFRLSHPQGRIQVSPLRITEQLAIIETKVFLHKDDEEPVASFIAERYAKATPGGLYIESAQHAATDQALNDAGFGVQFSDVNDQSDKEHYITGTQLGKSSTPVQAIATPAPAMQELVAPKMIVMPIAEANAPVPIVETPPTVEVVPSVAEIASPVEITPPVAEIAPPVKITPPVVEIAPPIVEAIAATPVKIAEMVAVTSVDTAVLEQAPQPEVTTPVEMSIAPPIAQEVTEIAEPVATPFTPQMSVDELCTVMTYDDAKQVMVDVGTCNGWTMEQVADRRAASLKWYLNGYAGENNILRAAAKLMLDNSNMAKAS